MAFDTSRRRCAGTVLRTAVLCVTIALAACGPRAANQAAAPRPSATPMVRSEVLILAPGRKMQEDVDFWTLENQRLVLAYFDIFLRHGFQAHTTDRVTVADDGFEAVTLDFEFEDMGEHRGSDWWAWIPHAGRVEHQGRHPDYVLIFDGLRFDIRSGGGSRQTYDRPGAGRAEVDVEYVLWDNRNQEVVASGKVHEESYTSSPDPSNTIFKELFEKVAAEVVRDSPLEAARP